MNKDTKEYIVFRNEEDNKLNCMRTTQPRFTVKCATTEDSSDIEFEDFFYIDVQSLTNAHNGLKPDPLVMTRIMREMSKEVADFLEKENKEANN